MKNIKLELVKYPETFKVLTDNLSCTVSSEKEAEIIISLMINANILKLRYGNKYSDVVNSSETKYKGDLLMMENVNIKNGIFIEMGETKFKASLPINSDLLEIIYRS